MCKSSRQAKYNKISYNNVIITLLRYIQNPGIFNAHGMFRILSNILDVEVIESRYSQSSLFKYFKAYSEH